MSFFKTGLMICLTALLLTGCIKSEAKLSNVSNTAYPLAPGAVYDEYNVVNGQWAHKDVLTIAKPITRAGYSYTLADPDNEGLYFFTLIDLGRGRYAAENSTENAFEYAFLEFTSDGIYKWEVNGNEIMQAIEADLAFQRELGTSCFEGECVINSVSDLKKIMNFILEKDFQSHRFYRQRS